VGAPDTARPAWNWARVRRPPTPPAAAMAARSSWAQTPRPHSPRPGDALPDNRVSTRRTARQPRARRRAPTGPRTTRQNRSEALGKRTRGDRM